MDVGILDILSANLPTQNATSGVRNGLMSFQNYWSYSTQEAFHTCPRRYMIRKIQAAEGALPSLSNIKFAFGHAVGAGVAKYDETRSLPDAIFEAFLSWDVDLLEEDRRSANSNGRSFAEAVFALMRYATFFEDSPLKDLTHVASETVFGIDFEDGHFYTGHIDEILRDSVTGKFVIKENKTTGVYNLHPAMYGNSDQALSYAIALSVAEDTSYEVVYTIYDVNKREWIYLPFIKEAYKKAEWLQDQLMLHAQQDTCVEMGLFPKRGSGCMSYGTACPYYGACDQFTTEQFHNLVWVDSLKDLESIEPMTYKVSLSDITKTLKGK